MSVVRLPVLQPELFEDPTRLPTNKHHVSFSECHVHNECGHRHQLMYVNGLKDEDTEHTTYGGVAHAALEDWLLKKDSVWFDWEERIKQAQTEAVAEFERIQFVPEGGAEKLQSEWIGPMDLILKQVPAWMDATFPGWQLVAAELPLFEPIEGQKNKFFKGYMDVVIRIPKPTRKGSKKAAEGYLYYILDWKTTSWGWDKYKKQDKFKRMQLALYKHYFNQKMNIPLEDIRCGFVLLKRTAKAGNNIELLEVSVGDKTREDAVSLVGSTVNAISRKLFMKNRNSCRFCKFKFTPECP